MVSEKELIDALNVIQKVCQEHGGNRNCANCPLRNCDDECGLLQKNSSYDICNPMEWLIKKPEDKPRVLMY